MPNSLRSKIKHLAYKGEFNERERDRLLSALDHEIADALEKSYVNGYYDALEKTAKRDWIPVSERMPDDGQDVLFCDIDEDVMMGYHIKGAPDTHFTQQGSYEVIKNVVAWMERPESYKTEKEEEE